MLKNTKLFAALSMVIALGLAAPGFAQEAEGPPAVGEPRAFSLPEVETYTLKNGVAVTLAPYGAVPKAVVRATVNVGNLNDGDTPWIADLTAQMMGEGAAGVSASEQAITAAAMGGDLNISVGLDQTRIAMDVLSEAAPDAVALIADVVQRPDLPEEEFDRVKQNLLRNISVAGTQPQTLADNAFTGAIYPDHPYARAILPSAEDFAALTLEDVKAFHGANFGGARTHIYVVGQFDRREVKKAIKEAFRDWDAGPETLTLTPAMPETSSILLVDRPGAVQSTIRLGKRVPPIDQTLTLEAADTILGGYFSSRITRNIREDKGYTYSPYSAISIEKNAAYWSQNADVTSEATGASLAEIVKEIEGLQAAPPAADELEGVKNYMNGIFVIRLASRAGMAGQLGFVDLHGLGLGYLENYVNEVRSLTAEDIQAAAQEYLQLDDMTLAVVGDLASVRGQLEAVLAFADRLPAQD